jgi:hypothetical protein
MSEEQLRRELVDSYKNRAILYALIFDELRNHCGEANAEEIMGQAIYRRGEQKGRAKYAQFAPKDLDGVKRAFLSGSADEGRMFQPEVIHEEPGRLDILHHKCPLLEAWREMGLPDEDVATLCRIASRIDYGTFEAAGFRFSLDAWQPGRDHCCVLHIESGK